MPILTAIPFLILLLGISFGPNFFAKVWHRFENLFLSFVSVITVLCLYFYIGPKNTFDKMCHIFESEYIPFVVIVLTLYTVSSSLKIHFSGHPTPLRNTLFLIFGGVLSNFIGTTGASMLLIHPLLRWNRHQKSSVHLVLFFIMIVSNIGGSLTPLGDAPLFVGYIQGVPFSWPFFNLLIPTTIGISILCCIFYILDMYINKQTEKHDVPFSVIIDGKNQLIFIPMILAILIFPINILFFREFLLLLVAGISYLWDKYRHNFLSTKGHWAPISEVARVFLAIFITLAPITLILKEGDQGALGNLLALTHKDGIPDPSVYFWMSGFFSAFLDNAPTYLLFLNMLGKDTPYILEHYNSSLIAISLGCVYFGAMTYIGNAPNFIVRNVAKQHGVHMPSFMGYIGYTCLILLPILIFLHFIMNHIGYYNIDLSIFFNSR